MGNPLQPSKKSSFTKLQKSNFNNNKGTLTRAVGMSQTLEGQNPTRVFITFAKWKSHRAVVGAVNLPSGAWGKAPESLQYVVTAVPQMA